MKRPCIALACAIALSPFAAAQAATLSHEAGKAMTTTDWSDVLTFARFDSNLGTLTSVRFDLDGTVKGAGSAESRDAASRSVTLTLGSVLTLTRPDGSALVVTNPVFSRSFAFTAFDGTIDFAGTSGAGTGDVTASGSDYVVSDGAADLALFAAPGGGTIGLGLTAEGNSRGTGSGNLVTQFDTAASGTARVTYAFTPAAAVPEPASVALMCGGLLLLASARRWRPVPARTKR